MSSRIAHTYRAIRETERAMGQLRLAGIVPGMEAYDVLARTRAAIWKSVGLKQPKVINILLKVLGLSPGIVKVFHDSECGWLAEARERPGAPPIYHYISDDQAIAILKGELTPELHDYLMTPDDYLGE